ncbi:MAG: hypothetical protein DI629_16345 [Mesorhizobium amorphae]|nr:MAG: hypothetical protein DI629_16345 [Mesorhizobium amorphae]
MTAITADRPLSLPLLSEFGRREPVLAISGLILLVALVPLGLAGITDARLVDGAPVWGKPFRFALALGVYLLTLAFFVGWMAPDARRSRLMRWTVWVGVAAIGFEQFWITWQAAHGEASHWNMSSPLAAAMWALMGVSAVILTLMAPVIGWLVWRRPLPDLAPVLRLGAVLGLLLTFPLTLLTAGTMAAHGAHLVGGTGAGEALWFMGWSREVGDLRVGHFFATHALQALPLAAAGMMALGLPRDRLGPVFGIAALYCGFVVFTFVQALMGWPFV